MVKNKKLPISALILTKNEESLIGDCLKQLDFVDEIIVLDEQSTDKTVNIVRKFTDNIINSKISNFSKNRNTLKDAAKNNWILYLDADERLSENSISEISLAILEEIHSVYYFPRKNIILGKWLKHGGWWPDYVPRLFKKSHLKTWFGEIHESPKVVGSKGFLKSPIVHLTAPDISRMLTKTIKYAKIEAKLQHEANHPKVNIPKVIFASTREFTGRYLIKLGFLDGTAGLIEALFQAYHAAVVLVYLWELQNHTLENYIHSDGDFDIQVEDKS